MLFRYLLACIFIVIFFRPAFAVEYCPVKVIAVSKLDCSAGLTYIGPLNKFKFGGYCIYPLRNCIQKVDFASSPNCPTGVNAGQPSAKYVGAREAKRFGGQCIQPSAGWKIETRQVADVKACNPPEIYLGPAKAGELGGHCVKIFK